MHAGRMWGCELYGAQLVIHIHCRREDEVREVIKVFPNDGKIVSLNPGLETAADAFLSKTPIHVISLH